MDSGSGGEAGEWGTARRDLRELSPLRWLRAPEDSDGGGELGVGRRLLLLLLPPMPTKSRRDADADS